MDRQLNFAYKSLAILTSTYTSNLQDPIEENYESILDDLLELRSKTSILNFIKQLLRIKAQTEKVKEEKPWHIQESRSRI